MALNLFNTILTPAQFTSANNNTTLTLALGTKTVVFCTTNATITFQGIAASGGNVDGMFVTLLLVNGTGSLLLQFAHEHASATASNRCWNKSLITQNGGAGVGGISYVYRAGAINRWIHVGTA